MKKRLTREESRALTQERLLDAAARLFALHGFAGASIEEIAETAGYSRGAFHANFKSKDALFFAVIDRQIHLMLTQIHKTMASAPTLTPQEIQNNLRFACACYTGVDKLAYLLLTEAQLYSVRNPRFGKKLSAFFNEIYDELIKTVEKLDLGDAKENSTMAAQLVLLAFSLSHGLVLHNLMNPERYPDTVVPEIMNLVFDKFFPHKG
jgi:AcrR family transcriptional regulator